MKKKMKRYEVGGSIDEGVRARAMKSVEGLEGIKGSDIEDETGTAKGSIKRNEYGDLYDSEMKATPKATPKAAVPKAEPKEEPKAAPKKKESAFKEGTSSFKDSSPAFKKGTSSFKEGTSSFKKMASGGKVSSASKRADGCAVKGKTKGRMV
jgi:hypothetical protein